MFNKKNFGSQISLLRKTRGILQQELADALGVGKSAVSMIENGERAASIEVVYALADYFDVPVGFLMGNKGTNLTEANLTSANMQSVKACGAIFFKANLTNTDLRDADLRWTDFRYANLHNAKLDGAKLEGAVFTGANVTGTILDGKIVDGKYCE